MSQHEKQNTFVRVVADEESSLQSSPRDDEYPAPSDEERQTLRKVAGSAPWIVYLLCLTDFAERASYYGASAIFSNFLEHPLPPGGPGTGAVAGGLYSEQVPGALNKGERFADAIILLIAFLAYAIPIFGAWLADVKIGKFNAIWLGVILCGIAHVVLIGGAAPALLQAGLGLAPFMVSLFILALGAGLYKPSILPMIFDQYTIQREYVKTTAKGERVVVDPETTFTSITLVFYFVVNAGAFYAIACTYAERLIGFWFAFLLAGIPYFLMPLVLLFLNKRLVKNPPSGSLLTQVFKIGIMTIRHGGLKMWKSDYWETAKPSRLAEKGITTFNGRRIDWTDKLVDDVRRTVSACSIFLYTVIWNVNDNGIGNTLTNQGGSMVLGGVPNDLIAFLNALFILVTAPLLRFVIYPFLRKQKISFPRISRMTFGFTITAVSDIFGALVQWKVYELSPCGYYASSCDSPAPISIWWQLPNVALGAISECFVNVTAYEIAYAFAPRGMEALVVALFLFCNALSSALSELVSPVTEDPYLIWLWAGPAIALALQTTLFWFRWKHLNNETFLDKSPGSAVVSATDQSVDSALTSSVTPAIIKGNELRNDMTSTSIKN